MPKSQPIKWFGGKGMIVSHILPHIPPHRTYIEPFAGGAAVLFSSDPVGKIEIINDIHQDLMNFWQVLQNGVHFLRFQRILQAMPFSEQEWYDARDYLQKEHKGGDEDIVERAVRFFVLNRQSLSGRMSSFTALTTSRTRRGMSNEASAWLSTIDMLPEFHERLRRVVLLNQDGIKVIQKYDTSDVFFYIDPPYLHSTRATTKVYRHEQDEAFHRSLLDVLLTVKGKVMLSGYPSDLYATKLSKWQLVKIEASNHAASGQTKRKMTECLWMNYPA